MFDVIRTCKICSRTFGCWRWCSSKFLKCNLTRTREPRNHHELLLVAMSCIPPCTLSSRPWSPTFQHAPFENGHEIFDRPWCPEENESKLYPWFKTILCNLALKTPKGIRSCWRNFQNLQDFFKFCNWVGSKSIHPFIQPSIQPPLQSSPIYVAFWQADKAAFQQMVSNLQWRRAGQKYASREGVSTLQDECFVRIWKSSPCPKCTLLKKWNRPPSAFLISRLKYI